ncbi:MAG: hypothetical protein DMF86_12390 [Acidobacteria bacterium]|nr:MAG: hypothetical protein DMF86_12390 [Acidobacteriota bacterium]
MPLPFRVSTVQQAGTFGGDRQLARELSGGKVQAKGLFVERTILKGVILASNDVTADQIPRKATNETPRIEVNIPSREGVGVPVGSLGPIVIRGHRFQRGTPIEVLVDGQPFKAEQEPQVDERGEFTVTIAPRLGVGGHTILVRQRTDRGVIQDAFTFNVTVRDEPAARPQGPGK